ncbi:MAG: hypothetical protein WAO52_04665 [Prolixibacteraceae bacterium]
MKRLFIYFLILCPVLAFGQIFPKVDDFKGNIRTVVEKRYGKEGKYLLIFKDIFRPTVYSGWKYTYEFDQNSGSIDRVNTFQGKLNARYKYERSRTGNKLIIRETLIENENGPSGDYTEYENFLSPNGQIEKTNFWIFNSSKGIRELFQVEEEAVYDGEKLVSFTSNQINEKGEITSGEKCRLFYDTSGRLSQIDRVDTSTGYTTTILYSYDEDGFVNHYSVDFLVELQEYGKSQIQYVYYFNDKRGNWTKTYQITDGKILNIAKRNISYY